VDLSGFHVLREKGEKIFFLLSVFLLVFAGWLTHVWVTASHTQLRWVPGILWMRCQRQRVWRAGNDPV